MLRRPLTRTPSLLLAASRAHGALGFASDTHSHGQQQQQRKAAPVAVHVTTPVFAGLLRKTGLSAKKLHKLDDAAQEHQQRTGSAVFPIAVALSGGADSMALTLLLREHLRQQKIATPLLAITVDHRLRHESAQEARDVGQMVRESWGVEHVVAQCEWASDDGDGVGKLKHQPAKPRGSKLQEEARKYRYSLLKQVCKEKQVKYLFVAHNLGDQLETVLFRLGRASGINGLAGIASVSTLFTSGGGGGGNEDGASALNGEDDDDIENGHDETAQVQLVRPLLGMSKAQLKETCRRFKQEWVEDPSNEKLQFDRIRIRKVRCHFGRVMENVCSR